MNGWPIQGKKENQAFHFPKPLQMDVLKDVCHYRTNNTNNKNLKHQPLWPIEPALLEPRANEDHKIPNQKES